MDNKNGNFHDFPVEQAMKLVNSDTGQQLIAHLQQQNGAILQQAMTKASSGDLATAKQMLSKLLTDPETARLLGKLKE